jgi:hypothetical protein
MGQQLAIFQGQTCACQYSQRNLKGQLLTTFSKLIPDNEQSIILDPNILYSDAFTHILKYFNINKFLAITSASKGLRKKYFLNSAYVLQYIKHHLEQNKYIPYHYLKLRDVHTIKISVQNIIKDNENKLIKISGTNDGKTKFSSTYHRGTIGYLGYDMLNIVSSLLKEQSIGSLILVHILSDIYSVTLPTDDFSYKSCNYFPVGEFELWFKNND